MIDLKHHLGPDAEAKCVAINPRRSEMLAVGANDVYARLYDRRMLTLTDAAQQAGNEGKLRDDCVTYFCPGHLNIMNDRKLDLSSKAITYLTFSPDGQELLVNMGAEQIYLFDVNHAKRPLVGTARRTALADAIQLPFSFSHSI